jgi:dTDP-4-amino-4,6-dideoxygalactose transaminase
MFKYPIAISLSPNTKKDDVLQAMIILCQPWKWKKGETVEKVEKWFQQYFSVDDAVSFNSGRSALYAILQTFNIGKDDEVLIQAFTCVAAVEPVIWAGAKPVFVDVEESLNIDPKLIESSISPKTKVIIVQHTFGVPAQINLIKKIVQKYKLILIEDCAHAFGVTVDGKKIGTFGQAAFFSFGRDKVISSVFGGMAIINGKWENGKLRKFQQKVKYPDYFWIFQQILHPVVFFIILPLYNLMIGKIALFILLKMKLVSKPIYDEEYRGEKPSIFPAKYPNALAYLLLNQLLKLETYNRQRINIANYYFRNLLGIKDIKLPKNLNGAIYLRFNILMDNAKEVLYRAKEKGVLLGNWYRNIVDPNGVELNKIGYTQGLCPKAEKAAQMSINLPTYSRLSDHDLNYIINLIKKYADKRIDR